MTELQAQTWADDGGRVLERPKVAKSLRYRGQTRCGTICGGTFRTDDLVAWVRNEFTHRRWRRLTILSGSIEVGGICKHLDTGHLIWWAEN